LQQIIIDESMSKKMKHTIATISILALLITLIQCKNDKSSETKSKQTTEKKATTPPEREEPRLVHDERGNIIERHANSYRKSDGSIRSRDSFYYTYDENNNVVLEVKESYEPDGTFRYKNVNHYTYNDKSLLIDLVFENFDADDNLVRTAHHSYKYNENGHKIQDIGYDTEGNMISQIILDPDEKGALRSEEFIKYDDNGEINDHKKYYYSQYGLEKSVDLLKDK
jgi:hypothetical protein